MGVGVGAEDAEWVWLLLSGVQTWEHELPEEAEAPFPFQEEADTSAASGAGPSTRGAFSSVPLGLP